VWDEPRYVCEGESGYLFDPHNAGDVADKLEAALNLTHTQYVEYGTKSRTLAEQTMSEDVFVNRYMSLLQPLFTHGR
jgi:hypothetical protein